MEYGDISELEIVDFLKGGFSTEKIDTFKSSYRELRLTFWESAQLKNRFINFA